MDEMCEIHRDRIFFIKGLAQVFMSPLGLNAATPVIILLFMFPIGFDIVNMSAKSLQRHCLYFLPTKKRRLGCDTLPSASDYRIIHVLLMVQRPLADSIYDLFTFQGKIVILFITEKEPQSFETQRALS